ncbi:MAG TPA: divalent metal cation transporter [Verrucomicrobiae bacterium]|nr:divalent metal cation transporter [Verrucomicrobiae bacterium]
MLADVDAASVLTAAKSGTDFGYAMLLPLVVLIPVLYFVQEMTARLAIGTGLGHAELIRERYGFRWAGLAVGTMVLIDLLAYVAEFAGIVLGASLVGVPAIAAVAGALVFHSAMVLTRSYRRFERITIALSLALFAFVGLAVLAHPDPAAVLGGLSPAQPFGQPGYFQLVVATIGAVVMPWMLFYQQAATVNKGLGRGDLGGARAETFIGAIASELLMAAIVIAAAAAAASGGVVATNAGGLALPAGLAILASGWARILIAIGMVGAGLLAAVVISLSSAWAWAELFHWPHSLNLPVRAAPAFYLVYLVEVIPAAIVALVAQNLVNVVIDAMILNVVVLAIPLAFLVRLSSDLELLGSLANSPGRRVLLWAITAGLLAFGLLGILGLAP